MNSDGGSAAAQRPRRPRRPVSREPCSVPLASSAASHACPRKCIALVAPRLARQWCFDSPDLRIERSAVLWPQPGLRPGGRCLSAATLHRPALADIQHAAAQHKAQVSGHRRAEPSHMATCRPRVSPLRRCVALALGGAHPPSVALCGGRTRSATTSGCPAHSCRQKLCTPSAPGRSLHAYRLHQMLNQSGLVFHPSLLVRELGSSYCRMQARALHCSHL